MARMMSLLPALLVFSMAGASAKAADLIVTVKDVRGSKGDVRIAVYDQGNYMHEGQTTLKQHVTAEAGQVKFVFHDLPPGTYAVSSFLDENGNGKLDRNFMGIPKEGYGFSNDARGTAGPPTFSQAKLPSTERPTSPSNSPLATKPARQDE